MVAKNAEFNLTVDPVFTRLMSAQREFQRRLYEGIAPAEIVPDSAKMNYLRTQALALTDEIHEALAETGWKPWATSNHLNREAYLGEMADVYIFFMNMLLVGDITMMELAVAVEAKQIKNNKRQDDGYDGVSTKCPSCKRAYDDDAVKCTPGSAELTGRAWCEKTGDHL